MNSILDIKQYEQEQLDLIADKLPAVARYLRLSEQPTSSKKDQLSIKRHRHWLNSAFATFFKKASAQEVCFYWSQEADKIITEAWTITCEQLNFKNENSLALFAFGKLGSWELNLSSDIDVLFICDKDPHLFEPFLKTFKALLHDFNEFGFIFRVDFDLRPGGRLGPLIPSPQQFTDYYSNYGETWERLALLRMRFICGSQNIEREIAGFNQKFCYRRHLDFSLLESIHHLRSQIHIHYRSNNPEKINLKLNPGGIRDIELFTHALLVIHGGKTPQIRHQQTSIALNALSENKLIEQELGKFLSETYWYLRQLENLVQIENDQQTHFITKSFCQKFNVSFDDIVSKMTLVSQRVESVIGPVPQQNISSSPDGQNIWLEKLGFQKNTIDHHWQRLQQSQTKSSRKRKNPKTQNNFLKQFIEHAAELDLNKDLAVANLADFIDSTKAKESLFSLFNHHPQLIKDLCYLFSLSPYLSRIICQRPDLLDSFLFRTHKNFSNDMALLLDELLERKLITELVSGFHFLGNKNLDKFFSSLTICADNIVTHLLASLKKEYGHSDLKVLCLGKWGGQELGLKADLDFILVTPGSPQAIDNKIAKRLVSRLTDAQRGGTIYDIDMRLTPYGGNNTLLVSEDHLKDFFENSAEAWQCQAYLRARSLSEKLNFDLQETLLAKKITPDDLNALSSIRYQLLKKNSPDKIDIKMSPGGIVDCEFHIQIAILQMQLPFKSPSSFSMLEALCKESSDWKNSSKRLIHGYNFLRTAEQLHRLSTQQPSSLLNTKSQSFQYLAKFFNLSPEEFSLEIQNILKENKALLNALDPLKIKV